MTDIKALADQVREADAVVAVGGRTQWDVGGRPEPATEVRGPSGVDSYDPADLTVTVGAGTTVAELEATVGASGQEVGLDARDPDATVGGVLATGLSGARRLRYGPLRDTVLETRFVTADGRVITGGGPTVKNVTGYDVPRLMIGSLGTLGVLARVTLRCRPRPAAAQWFVSHEPAAALIARLYRPSSILGDGRVILVLLEGHPEDVLDEAGGLAPCDPATWPVGPHRGRASVAPSRVGELVGELHQLDVTFLAEWGVGTVHVASATSEGLAAARDAAQRVGGWLLREAGGDDLDAWGRPLPDRALHRRIKLALDPQDKLGRGRFPW